MIEKCSDTELKVQVVPLAASRTCRADDCMWDLRGACCQVRGGKLKARKGVNVPEVQIDCAALTEKDIEEKGESRHCTWKAVTVASQTHAYMHLRALLLAHYIAVHGLDRMRSSC